MKNQNKYRVLVFILLCLAFDLSGQPINDVSERVSVSTDRTLYIAGENVQFSARVIIDTSVTDGLSSQVLYVEIVEPDGKRISGGKYAVEYSSSQGCLHIPEETLSGIYYLKSYTRWMRNSSLENYSFTPLKVINPYNAEMLTGKDTATLHFADTNIDSHTYTITAGSGSFRPGDTIRCRVERNGMHDIDRKLSISVIPSAAFISWDSIRVLRDSIPAEIQYYPETRGISISGRFVEENTGQPFSQAFVNLSLIGSRDVMAIRTNASGRFYFALPGFAGKWDIFLCGEDIPGKETEILIDNDFCSRHLNLPAPMLNLSEDEMETAYIMALNQKISSVFYRDRIDSDSAVQRNDRPFYGVPDEVLEMDKFLDLPTVEDYFSELVGAVNVRKFEGRKIFRFNSTRTEMTIYDPLVLIDWVAVNDIEKILAMQPKQIERIELVDAPYIKGNINYGGIISFISKNNDFAGIDLPSSGTFINYTFMEACLPTDVPPGLPVNLPDARNTIYWNPYMELDSEGYAEVLFIAPATPGNYIIVLREIESTGKLDITTSTISIIPEGD